MKTEELIAGKIVAVGQVCKKTCCN